MQTEKSPSSQSLEHNKLIEYLDEFGRQISSRKSNSHSLQEQLASLSRAYSQAQEKLLETQKALMNESIMAEKYRSVIEIYKHILRQNMEDESIASFIQTLEEDESKQNIYEEMEEIKNLLSRKRLANYKKSRDQDKQLSSLKKEISRLCEQRDSICDESSLIHNENYELKIQNQRLKADLGQKTKEVEQMANNLKILTEKIDRQQTALQELRKQASEAKLALFSSNSKIQQLQELKKQLGSINCLLTDKLNMQGQKQNRNSNSKNAFLSSEKYNLSQIQSKLTHLLKCKYQYKKLKESHRSSDFTKKQISLLKLFLSEEALSLFKEYQAQQIDCLETELRNLAVTEKNKLIHLQDCQRDVWKYRLQLLKQDQLSQLCHSTIELSNTLRHPMQGSFSSVALIESLKAQTQPVSRQFYSQNPVGCISEFKMEVRDEPRG